MGLEVRTLVAITNTFPALCLLCQPLFAYYTHTLLYISIYLYYLSQLFQLNEFQMSGTNEIASDTTLDGFPESYATLHNLDINSAI